MANRYAVLAALLFGLLGCTDRLITCTSDQELAYWRFTRDDGRHGLSGRCDDIDLRKLKERVDRMPPARSDEDGIMFYVPMDPE